MSEEQAAAAVAEGAPENVVIPLRYPIRFGSQVIDSLTVRPMTGGVQRRMTKRPDTDPIGMMSELGSLLTGQPSQVIDALTGNDLGALNVAVQVFFTASQEIGSGE